MHVDYSITQIPDRTNILISNSSARFHLGMMYGEATDGGTRYGYLSNFANLETSTEFDQCVEDSVQLTGRNGDSWTWFDPDSVEISNEQSIVASESGAYTLLVEVDGCVLTETMNVVVTDPPVIDLSENFDPCVSPREFDASIDTSITSFIWSTGSTDPTIPAVEGGTYTVTVSNQAGCFTVDTITIPDYEKIEVTELPGDCQGTPLPIDAWEGDTYVWTGPDDFTSDQRSITAAVSGDYSVSVTDSYGCTLSASTTVFITEPPVINPPTDFDYCNGVVVVDLQSTEPGLTYRWSTGATTSIIETGTNETVWVTVTDADGCSSSTYITTPELEGPSFSFDTTTSYACSGALLSAEIVSSSDYEDLVWSIDGQIATRPDTIIGVSFGQVVALAYSATVTGCPFEGEMEIEIPGIENIIQIHQTNVFTPNNDQINDVYLPLYDEFFIPCVDMIIYDRWGRMMYRISHGDTENPTGWDGKSPDGIDAPAGVYYVIFQIFDENDVKAGEFHDSITLMRD